MRHIKKDNLSDLRLLLRVIASGNEQSLSRLEPADPLFFHNDLGWITLLFKGLGLLELAGLTRHSRKGWHLIQINGLGLVQWRRGVNRLRSFGAWIVIKVNGITVVSCDPANDDDSEGDEMFADYVREQVEAGIVDPESLRISEALIEIGTKFTPAVWATNPTSGALGALYYKEWVD